MPRLQRKMPLKREGCIPLLQAEATTEIGHCMLKHNENLRLLSAQVFIVMAPFHFHGHSAGSSMVP